MLNILKHDLYNIKTIKNVLNKSHTLTFFFVKVDLGIEYNRYLREVVETLETDDIFRKKLENANEADIRVCNMYNINIYYKFCR